MLTHIFYINLCCLKAFLWNTFSQGIMLHLGNSITGCISYFLIEINYTHTPTHSNTQYIMYIYYTNIVTFFFKKKKNKQNTHKTLKEQIHPLKFPLSSNNLVIIYSRIVPFVVAGCASR